MALNGFLLGVRKNVAEVLTNSGRIIRVPAERASGLPPISRVRAETKTRKGTTRQLLAFDYLTHIKGWKPHQAAAIVGRLSQESGADLNTKAVGDKGTAFGLAQTRGVRNVRRLKFHNENGNNPKDLFAELDFVDWELKNHEIKAYQTISAARTIDEAAVGMMMYERPKGYTLDNPKAGHGWNNTIGYSTAVMEDAGIDPDSNFDVAEGSEPMELPDMEDPALAEAPGPTRLGDVMDFSAIGGQEDQSEEEAQMARLAGQRQSIQDRVSGGVQAQMNWGKPV